MDTSNPKLNEMSRLREEVRERLAVLRTEAAPILNELSRLEKLAESLDDFDQIARPTDKGIIGSVPRVMLPERPPRTAGGTSGDKTTPHDDFTFPILDALHEFGGAATRDAVLNRVELKLKGELKHRDFERLASCGDARWRNRASFQKKNMIREGLLRGDSRYGIWEMTPKGHEYLRNHLNMLKRIFGDDYGSLGQPEP